MRTELNISSQYYVENMLCTQIAFLYYSNIADYQNPQQIYCSKVRSLLGVQRGLKGKKCPRAINRHFVLYELNNIFNRIQFSVKSDL